MKLKGLQLLLASVFGIFFFFFSLDSEGQTSISPSHLVPINKNLSRSWDQSLWQNKRRIYMGKELRTIGMPCGGIAAGQLYVRGDGSLANWWISNDAYNTGYGIDSLMNFKTALGPWKVCYQTFTPPSYIDQGFSISIRRKGKTETRKLNKEDFDDISFIGEYPVAFINYSSKVHPIPLKVDMQIFSPFIPLNARESATPGTVIKFVVKNTGATPLDISLNGWLQNLVFLDSKQQLPGQRRNRVLRENNLTSVQMDMVNAGSGEAFMPNHPYSGNISLSILESGAFADADFPGEINKYPKVIAQKNSGEKLVGAVAKSVSLLPGQQKEIVFLLTWYFPNRPSYYYGYDVTQVIPNNWNEALPVNGTTILGNMYANWFSSSGDVATWLCKNLNRLSTQTILFHDSYYKKSTIPYWLNSRLLMPVSTLATETCQWWANDKFWAWEGVGSCVGTCTHVWNYEQAMSRLFPELERNVRERTDFASSFQKDGSILARNGWGDVLIDGDAGAIIKAYREHLFSKDNLFLTRNWPKIKKATEFLIAEDGNEDGLIEKQQPNTYDIAFFGANTYVGGLYLTALRSAAAMATLMNDSIFAKKCTDIFISGSTNSVEKLWDGQYFKQDVDLVQHPKYQYADGCLSDQLFGQTLAHLTSLGYIYPEKNVKTTLQSIWNYNWAPDVGPQNKKHPAERIYADPGEAGLFICTWPKGVHMGENGVRYRDEVWTGIEYQVATNMIYENMIPEALSLIKSVDNRYAPEKHNPWNEIECGDHYARAMASWGVLLALENYYYNGPAEEIGFSPKIQGNHFQSFFTSAEAWGNLSQDKSNRSQTNTIEIRYGQLALRHFSTSTEKKPVTVAVLVNDKKIVSTYSYQNEKLNILFDRQLLKSGQTIRIVTSY